MSLKLLCRKRFSLYQKASSFLKNKFEILPRASYANETSLDSEKLKIIKFTLLFLMQRLPE